MRVSLPLESVYQGPSYFSSASHRIKGWEKEILAVSVAGLLAMVFSDDRKLRKGGQKVNKRRCFVPFVREE